MAHGARGRAGRVCVREPRGEMHTDVKTVEVLSARHESAPDALNDHAGLGHGDCRSDALLAGNALRTHVGLRVVPRVIV